MKKKILAGAVTLLSVVTLAACSQNSSKDIVTMKGATITEADFYDKVKTNAQAQNVLLQMTIEKVFEAKYGKNVTDKEVNEAYEENAKNYGDNFATVLAQAGLTADTYREQIRANKLVEYAVKQAAEKEATDENLKNLFDSYTPEVTANIIKLDSEDKAKEVLEKAKADGADFAALAKENSTDTSTKDNGGEVKFDSGSTDVPDAVKSAAFALDTNGVSDIVTVTDSQTYTTSYYIVKVSNKTSKSDNWKDYKKRLKEIFVAEREKNASFIQSVVGAELTEANIKVKDEAFQSLFAQYSNAANSSSSTSSTTESSSSSDSSSASN
ncbi:putative parvulin type peptidyl-prolyl isomerase, similarity with PrsA foldase [Streptococcus sp. DD10]|uniref:peptidylprolyl isomerase PrsA n=1 Tax=Streptococcus sp. DD10 TaxID=1777878 RepID=UPI00079B83A9|nr:peptidylprolyl isomerase PrsA [Streptococcus sp. DD10]KXT73660.1 putative parvulin type peptidyl-prolyl isomerase, similarity with PrsA foldase [Streptococcus sp. DD10]